MKAFSKDQMSYKGNLSPDNKYQNAAKVWDDRIGSARVQAKNWRLMALLSGGVSLSLAIMLGLVASNKQVETFVVPIDNLGRIGEVRLLGDVYEPQKAEIGFFLSEFVKKIRSKSIDPIVMRENWISAYDYIAMEAKPVLDKYARETNPLEDIGKSARSVKITNTIQRSLDTYQINWMEQEYVQGSLVATSYYTGIFTVGVEPPQNREAIKKNPLGIKIKSMTWEQEYNNAK